jgi:hypothetical protein
VAGSSIACVTHPTSAWLMPHVRQRPEAVDDVDRSQLVRRIGRPMALRQATAERGGSRGATAGTDRAGCGPIVEVPRCFLSTLKAGFFSSARARLEAALLASRPHRGMGSRQRLDSESLCADGKKNATPGGRAAVRGAACSGPEDGARSSRAAHQLESRCGSAIGRTIL